MTENAKQFLLDRALNYYKQTLMPELNRLGLESDRFVVLLKELALETSPKITLDRQQQLEFLEQLMSISVKMFDSDRHSDLKVYKTKLRGCLRSEKLC